MHGIRVCCLAMRLHPSVSPDQARDWLLQQAASHFQVEPTDELRAAVQPFAEAMAAVSAVELPDDAEPAFP
jgi:hypothetical protein